MQKIKKKVFKFLPFSKKQKQVLTWWVKNSPYYTRDYVIIDGAIRSGKSIIASLSFVLWAMSNFSYQNFAMAGRTIGSFRRNVLFLLKLMLIGRGYKIEDRRTDNLLIVRKNGIENYFYIFGGKDEKSQDLIQGFTCAGLYLDEVALMPESFVNQAVARCSVEGAKIWFACNPEGGEYHWFKLEWLDKLEIKNGLRIKFTLDDNPSLSEKRKKFYKSMFSGVFYKRYILGLWVIAEGLIYDMVNTKNFIKLSLKNLEKLKNKEQYISIDYGTQNPCVFLLWKKVKDRWICINEYYYSGKNEKKQKTDAEYADDLKEFAGGIKRQKDTTIIVDPSAASLKAELRKKGWKVINADNDVLNGIRETQKYIKNRKLLFNDEKCENIKKEFQSYSWDKDKSEKGKDEPLKENDHCMDALRYMVYTVIRFDKMNRESYSGKGKRY